MKKFIAICVLCLSFFSCGLVFSGCDSNYIDSGTIILPNDDNSTSDNTQNNNPSNSDNNSPDANNPNNDSDDTNNTNNAQNAFTSLEQEDFFNKISTALIKTKYFNSPADFKVKNIENGFVISASPADIVLTIEDYGYISVLTRNALGKDFAYNLNIEINDNILTITITK